MDIFMRVGVAKCPKRGHFDLWRMAKLTCFAIAGMRLWFYSNDHEPPHFHAKRRGEWEYKVNFMLPPDEMFELIRSTKKAQLSRGDRKLLEQMVEQHRFEILREWEAKVNPHET
jgi:Domain of unknown function (DUF4160)